MCQVTVLVLTLCVALTSGIDESTVVVPRDAVVATPSCGMEDKRGRWRVEGVTVSLSDKDLQSYMPQIFMVFRKDALLPQTTICTIALGDGFCRENPDPEIKHCYCRSKVKTGDTNVYNIHIDKTAAVEDSGRRLDMVFYAVVTSETDKVFPIGRAPTVYEPISAYYIVDNYAKAHLNDSSQPLEVIAYDSDKPLIQFCVKNLLIPFSPEITLNGVKRSSAIPCVKINGAFDWDRRSHYDVRFSYSEYTGCLRKGAYVGTVRPKAGLPALDIDEVTREEVTKSKKEDKFKNLETIYIVMLVSMAAIWLIACIIGYIWYRQKTDQIKSFREQEMQGAMDFDTKFDLRGSKISLETSSQRSTLKRSQRIAYSPEHLRMDVTTPKVEYVNGLARPPPPPSYEQSLKVEEETTNDALNSNASNDSLNHTTSNKTDVDLPSDSDSDPDSSTQNFKVDLHPISEEMESDAGNIHIEVRGEPTKEPTNRLNDSNCSDI